MKSLQLITQIKSPALEQVIKDLGPVPQSAAEKIDYLVMLNDALDQKAALLKKEADAITSQKKQLDNVHDEIRAFIKSEMTDDGLCEAEGVNFKLQLGNSAGSVEIVDESLLPDDFFKTVRTPDKTKIKAAMTLGQMVEGAVLQRGQTLKMVSKNK